MFATGHVKHDLALSPRLTDIGIVLILTSATKVPVMTNASEDCIPLPGPLIMSLHIGLLFALKREPLSIISVS